MKKSTRLIAFILTLALTFGCISFGTFAEEVQEAAVQTVQELPKGGIKTVGELKEEQAIEPILLNPIDGVTDDIKTQKDGDKAGFTTKYNYGTAFTKGADGNYVSMVKTDSSTAKDNGSYDYYFAVDNAKGKNYATAESNFEKYAGKSFVISMDIKLSDAETWGDGQKSLGLFTLTTPLRTDKASATLKPQLLRIAPDGSLIYNVADASDTRTAANTVSREEFTTVAVFVRPVDNEYDVYVDGELLVEGATFMTSADEILLVGREEDAGKGSTANFIPGSVRLMQGTKALTADVLDFDNFKFYYADYYFECTHSFEELDGHNHDLDNGFVSGDYVCEDCALALRKQVPLEFDELGRCTVCAENLLAETYLHHDTDTTTKLITDNGGEVIKAFDGTNADKIQGEGINHHVMTDSFGNAFVSVGKTTDTASTATYNQIFAGNSVSIDMLKNNTAKKGDFVVQLDIKLEEGYKSYAAANPNKDYHIIETCTYVNDNDGATDTVNVLTAISKNSSVRPSTLDIRNGYIRIDGENVCTLSYDEYATLAYHAHPETNTVDVYVNGVCVAEGKTFIPEGTNYNRIHFKYDTGTKDANGEPIYYETGIKDFVLGWVRVISSPVESPDAYYFSYDNAFVYYSDEYADDYSKHQIELKSVTDLGNGYQQITYECDVCHAKNDVLAKGKTLVGEDIGALMLAKGADLGEYVGFELFAEIDDATLAAQDAVMVISVGDREYSYPLSGMKRDKETYAYVFRAELTAVEMCDEISAKIVAAAGETTAYTTSFSLYAEELINATDNAALKTLLYATLTYGAYAQDYFAAYKGASYENAPVKYYTEEQLAAADAKLTNLPVIENGSDTITPYSVSLVLESTLSVNIFFSGNAAGATADGTALEILPSGKMNVVTVSGITPKGFANDVVVTLTDADGNSDTVTLSVLDCAALVVDSADTSAEFKNLARALYFYNEAAKAYVNN